MSHLLWLQYSAYNELFYFSEVAGDNSGNYKTNQKTSVLFKEQNMY